VGQGDAVLTRERHRRALERIGAALDRVSGGDAATELAAEDVRLALRALGEITGRVDVEDVLDRLFATFCIGK
jgi:tRNA modification GTPase